MTETQELTQGSQTLIFLYGKDFGLKGQRTIAQGNALGE